MTEENTKPKSKKPPRRNRKKKSTSLGAKNKPFKLHDYLHPSSGYITAGGS